MNLDKELLALKVAAISIDEAISKSETLISIRKGNPFDQIFFENLSDPRWLPPLREAGCFATLPDEKVNSDGTTTFPRSLAIRGLQNLTESAPGEVLDILEVLPDSQNPQVIDQITRCIASIQSANLISRCAEILLHRLNSGAGSHWVWVEEILNDWLRLGNLQESLRLFERYVDSLIASRRSRYGSGDGWQLSEIDRNYVEEIVSNSPGVLAPILFRCLVAWKERERELSSDLPSPAERLFDSEQQECDSGPPTYWMEDFKHRGSSGHELEQILATRLFETGSAIFADGDESVVDEFEALLRSDTWELFSRLRWQLYADHPAKTVDRARTEVLLQIPNLSLYSGSHGFEMAQMLQEQSRTHGSNFLAPPEVDQFFRNVMEGPIDHEGLPVIEERYVRSFRRKQLEPIRSLLIGPARDVYEALAADYPDLPMASYKPVSSGGRARTIEHVAPKQAEDMASMSDEELWYFLNTWKPAGNRHDSDQWWIEESVSALGPIFADLLDSQPERFPASVAWWRNLTRPAVLYTPLERAVAKITKENREADDSPAPTENEWRNWFGLADWIAELGRAAAASESPADNAARPEDQDWNWPRIIAVKFLAAAIDPRFPVPDDLKPEIGRLLQKSVEDPDPRLASKDKPWMEDWLTTAINSVRGTALEYLLVLALTQKKERPTEKPDEWIFDVIQSTLSAENQSPAVFAIMGARLNLALYVYGKQFKQLPDLLLPQDRHDQRNAFILSQVQFGKPLGVLIEILPNYPSNTLDFLAELNKHNQGDSEQLGNFGGQLGFHLFFYDWNVCYSDIDSAKVIVNRYFDLAKPSQRGHAIRDVARIFSQTAVIQENEPLFERVRMIWDRRFTEIQKRRENGTYRSEDVHEELSAFLQWIECECHPFEWRAGRVLQAIKLLEKPAQAASIIRTLETLSNAPEKLGACTEILEALISKESEIVSWTYREQHLKPILNRGLQSGDQVIEERVRRIQEILLRQGLFDYLELDTAG